jgi:hypothetical protein
MVMLVLLSEAMRLSERDRSSYTEHLTRPMAGLDADAEVVIDLSAYTRLVDGDDAEEVR